MEINFSSKQYLNIFKHPLMGVTFPRWCQILWENKLRISFPFLPKVLFICIVSILNIPFHVLEYLLYTRRIKKEVVKAPIFIIGHPRSGTTHLHYLMSKDESKAFCTLYQGLLPHSFLVGGKILRKMMAKSIPKTRPQDEVKIGIDSPKEEEFAIATMSGVSYLMTFYFPRFAMKHFKESVLFEDERKKNRWKKSFQYFIQKLSYVNQGKQLILKSPANTGRVKEILEVFPDAKFVHISRNPIEVYQSTVKLYEKVVEETSFQKVNEEELEVFIIEAYRLLFQKYENDKELIPKGNLVHISYEELLTKGLLELKKVYDDLCLSGYESNLANFEEEFIQTKDYKRNRYSPLSKDKLQELEQKWGRLETWSR